MRKKCIYVRGFFIIVNLILLSGFDYCLGMNSFENQKKSGQDSLLSVLRNTTDVKVKLKSLFELSRLNWETPEEVGYLQQLMETAAPVDSMNHYYYALSGLGRYYCNLNKLDSLLYWGGIFDSVTKVRKETPHEAFDFLNYYCRYYLNNEEYELAMNEAVRLQMLSDETGNLQGTISSNEYLGLIYIMIGRDRDAATALEKGMSLLKESGGQPDYEMQLTPFLLIAYLRLNELEKMRSLLVYYESVIHMMESERPAKWMNYPFRQKYCFLYSYYTNLYIAEDKPKEAKKAMQQAFSYVDDTNRNDPFLISVYNLAMARYYFYVKKYPEAIREIDKVLSVDYPPPVLWLYAVYQSYRSIPRVPFASHPSVCGHGKRNEVKKRTATTAHRKRQARQSVGFAFEITVRSTKRRCKLFSLSRTPVAVYLPTNRKASSIVSKRWMNSSREPVWACLFVVRSPDFSVAR